MPFIVLEGNDGAGKSTLATIIAETFLALPAVNKPVVNLQHVGNPAEKRADQTVQDYADQEYERLMRMVTCYDPTDPDLLFVYDRFHSGSAAYGPIFRPGANMDEFGQLGRKYFEDIELELAARGARTFYVMPSVEQILERTGAAPDEYLDERSGARNEAERFSRRRQQLMTVQDRYQMLLNEHIDVLHSFGGTVYAQLQETPFSAAYGIIQTALRAAEMANARIASGLHPMPEITPVVDSRGVTVLR